jgi:hypothetical protein
MVTHSDFNRGKKMHSHKIDFNKDAKKTDFDI